MTREEITKEAQEQVNYCTPIHPEDFIHGYIAAAENWQAKYEKQKEINKELEDENEALKFAARMSEKTEKQLREKNKDLADCNSRLLSQAAAATKRIIQLEKDNWHDLRKDPKDLPDEGSYLVVWSNARGYRDTMIMRYEEDDEEKLHWTDGEGDYWDDDVIAWREIPKFEEETK